MRDQITKAAGVFIAIFGGVWTFLDPLGGIGLVENFISHSVSIYIIVSLCALTAAISTFISASEKTTPETVTNPAILEAGASRADFDQLTFLQGARNVIRAIGISLPSLATERGLHIIESLILHHKVTIELIICNPSSPAMPKRQTTVYAHGTQPATTAQDTLNILKRFAATLGPTYQQYLSIHVTDHPFGIGMLQADDKILWSPVLSNRSGATAPYQICQLQSYLGKCFSEHFLTIRTKFSSPLKTEQPETT